MRILFFTHYFPPEVNAPASRTHEHCREWVKAGHDVHVVTCIPSHPLGTPFPGFRRRWYQHDEIDGIHVHRVWTYLAANRGTARRTANYLSFVPTAAFRAARLGRFDVVIGTSPQFFCAVAAWLYARARPTPWVFELRDLWPESIAAVGAKHASFALRLVDRLALRLYRDATAVACLTKSFVETLASKGIERSKLHWIPNGIEPSFWQGADRAAERRELGVHDDEVLACYAGTIGMAHGLATVLDAAAILRTSAPHLRFLIVGDGAEFRKIREMASRRGLESVRFTGLVPRERVAGILAAADIALVTLRPADVFKTVLPSKMFEAMAARLPIVLAVDGEARATLERAQAGLAVQPGDATAMASAMIQLASDEHARARMGAAGAAFVDREFCRCRWAQRYLDVLSHLRARETGGPVRASDLPLKDSRG